MEDFLANQQMQQMQTPPECPPRFHLLENPVPLAGPEDTYWIAEALWVAESESHEGFLIYAGKLDYLFLDRKEAHLASRIMAGPQRRNQPEQSETHDHVELVENECVAVSQTVLRQAIPPSPNHLLYPHQTDPIPKTQTPPPLHNHHLL